MNKPVAPHLLAATETRARRWQREYATADRHDDREVAQPLGHPDQAALHAADRAAARDDDDVGFPGQPDYTRGIYATMHRGRTWTQRQLDRPRHAGRLQRAPARHPRAQGATAVSLIPCNSVYRGYDMDEVDAELLGTCGVVVNTADHMDTLPRRRRPRATSRAR